jgi:hypothetical protein
VNDTDRVYAVFMQANPVPDPSLLPTTRAEAALPIMEGSTIMDTRETTQARPEKQVRGWRPVAVVAAAFVVVLLVVGGVLLLMGGDGDPVAAADAKPVVTCDGETCTWEGPMTVTPGLMAFEFVNDGTQPITFAVWTMTPTAADEELANRPVGTDIAIPPGDEAPSGMDLFYDIVQPGSTQIRSSQVASGYTYLVDCLTSATDAGEDYYDHLWRPAAIEVVEP